MIELDIIARPIAERIAEIYTPKSPPYRKINPREVSKLLSGWYVTAYDDDGNEIEIHIETRRKQW